MPTTPPRGVDAGGGATLTRWRLRRTACSLLLVALTFVQTPGMQAADTKLDLVVDPGGMLSRAWSMWDPLGAFGQVGNQAYGYFWPMGPFFLAGDALQVPTWVVQRLWMALVLVVAFEGVVRLARAFGMRSDLAVVATGLAYALSPRLLTTVGPISIEAWPSALAPWVLLCLVRGSQDRNPRAAALGAALATAMVGGVNAAATFAVIPLGVIWLLTRESGPRRRALMLWWPLFTVVACLWWLVPLVILGRYSPPFLDYIETADLTTYPTTVFSALRGTSDWIPYLEPRWRAGTQLIVAPVVIVNSTIVVLAGLLGLSRRDQPHRSFLVLGLLTGLVMVTAGHLGGHGGWFAVPLHDALDGVLSPLRNVHKFDPLIRLPLVLGLGHVIDSAVRGWVAPQVRGRLLAATSHFGLTGVCLVAVVGAAMPILSGRLVPGSSFAGVPGYWRQAAAWVGSHGADQRTLLEPASKFGQYVWGNTGDEPLQPLAKAPWAVRDVIPLAPTGNIRALDAVEQALSRGQGSAGLAEYLHRMGVTYLLVRNDLQPSAAVADPTLVHQAIAGSPGIVRVRTFGPVVGGAPQIVQAGRRLTVNQGWQASYPAIEVYRVQAGAPSAVTSAHLPVVIGAPEDLLTLSDVMGDRPSVLGYDADTKAVPSGPVVLTDGLRLRNRVFGQIVDGYSPTLTEQESQRLGAARRDYLVGNDRWSTHALYRGASGVSASSSASDAGASGGSRTADLPYAAVDGDSQTQWMSDPGSAKRPSLTLDLVGTREVDRVSLTAGSVPGDTDDAPRVVVRTARGASSPTTLQPGVATTFDVPAGKTSWVRVEEVRPTSAGTFTPLALAELDVPDVTVSRWLVPPRVPTAWGAPDVISLDAGADTRTGCAQISGAVRCATGRGPRDGEEASGLRRVLRLPSAADYAVTARVIPRSGSAAAAFLQRGLYLEASASSDAVDQAAASSPLAAVDGEAGTTWIADADDQSPSFDLSWLGKRTISSLSVSLDEGAPARRPTAVTVSYAGGSQAVRLDARGRAALRPVSVSGVSLTVIDTQPTANVEPDGSVEAVGAGISELRVGGLPYAPVTLSDLPHDYGCGSGPVLSADGVPHRTAVVGSPHAIFLGQVVSLRVCDGTSISLTQGYATVQLGATALFSPDRVTLTRVGSPSLAAGAGLEPAGADGDGSLRTSPDADTLVLRHNDNPGWTATARGKSLDPVVVDGWQQGFRLPPGTTRLATTYAPTASYRGGLLLGWVLLLAEVCLWARWRRRPPADARPGLGQARLSALAASVACVVGAGVLCGTAGLLLVAGVGGVLLLVRNPLVRLAVGLAPLVLTGVWYAAEPWGGSHTWAGEHLLPQLLSVTSLALLAVTAGAADLRGRQRITGASTSR